MFKDMKKPKSRAIANSKKLYNYIHEYGPISKAKLIELSGLTLSTLTRAMEILIRDELIYICDIGESSGGRKPGLYRVNSSAGYIIGIDISRTYTKVALMDIELNILKSSSFGMFSESVPQDTLEKICNIIDDFSKEFHKEKIIGVGIGAVGPIDREEGKMLNPLNFPALGWKNVSIKKIIEEKTGLITMLENGASAAVLGEHKKGVGKNVNNIAYIILGVGVRLGMLSKGEILNSPNSNEGAFGHTVIDINGKNCSCGQQGCLEAYVSIKAIIDKFKEGIQEGSYSSFAEEIQYDLSEINIDSFSKAAKSGDKIATQVIDKATSYLAVGVTNLVNILNPELIIIGGPIIKKCDVFYEMAVNKAMDKIKNITGARVIFSSGSLEDDAIVVGAGSRILDYYLK